MSRITKFFLATLIVAALSTTSLFITKAFSDTNNKNSVVQPSGPRQLTAPVDYSRQALRPGHDFGAIYGATDLGISMPVDPPLITYWVNGLMVVRRSELGPLTGTFEDPLPKIEPGHDFGAIYGTIDPGLNLSGSAQGSINRRR
jgi:hypothetical protein